MDLNFYILVLLLSAILSSMIGTYLWVKGRATNTPSLVGLLLSISIWCAAAAFELAVITYEAKWLFTIICYVGIISIPVWFLRFALEYTGLIQRVSKRIKVLVWILPLTTFIILTTNPSHNLFYSETTLETIGNINYQNVKLGVWWWVHFAYSYLLVFSAVGLFFWILFYSSTHKKGEVRILLLSTLFPLMSNMLYISGIRPLSFVDLTPVAFAATGLMFFWGIYSGRFFRVKPIALNTLFDSLPDGIIVLGKDHKIIETNTSASHILEQKNKAMVGKHIGSILTDLSIEKNGANDSKQERITFRDKILDLTHSTILNEAGQTIGFLFVMRDVSKQLKAEQELKAVSNRFELAVAAAGFDPWENNLLTGERIGGEKIYEKLGYHKSDIPKTIENLFKLVHPDDIPIIRKRMDDHFKGKTPVYTCDFRVKDTKGNYQWVANFAKLVERDENGKPLRFIGLTLNINERKRFEEKLSKKNEELIKANAEKDKFFSIIAHDLKGPFQGFIGLTQLMSESLSNISMDEMQEITQSMKVTAKNLYELLDNLLNWALIKRGHKRFNPEKIRLNALVKGVVEIVSTQLDLKRIILNNNTNASIDVLVDRESVKTILRNILSNAIKFTPEGGEITVNSIKRTSGFIDVSIKDSGIGMPESISEKLFKLDQKVSRLGTNKEPSTGLGLILCKELVEKHGGKIWVNSQEGEGSEFVFSLPMVN